MQSQDNLWFRSTDTLACSFCLRPTHDFREEYGEVAPYCYLHGYTESETNFHITRFLRGYFADEQGHVADIKPCELTGVPHYEPPTDSERKVGTIYEQTQDIAWSCMFKGVPLYVVFSPCFNYEMQLYYDQDANNEMARYQLIHTVRVLA